MQLNRERNCTNPFPSEGVEALSLPPVSALFERAKDGSGGEDKVTEMLVEGKSQHVIASALADLVS